MVVVVVVCVLPPCAPSRITPPHRRTPAACAGEGPAACGRVSLPAEMLPPCRPIFSNTTSVQDPRGPGVEGGVWAYKACCARGRDQNLFADLGRPAIERPAFLPAAGTVAYFPFGIKANVRNSILWRTAKHMTEVLESVLAYNCAQGRTLGSLAYFLV